MKRVPLKLFLLVALSLSPMLGSCSSTEPWTFAATRAFYSETATVEPDQDNTVAGGTEVFATFVGFLLLPIAFDLAVLPIALMRDWIVLD